MAPSPFRVDYDLIAHLYDEPGRDYDLDPNLVKFLEEKAMPPSGGVRLLDLGCGTGKQLTADHGDFPKLQMVGLDRFRGMLLQARQRCAAIPWLQGDAVNLPFADNSFDFITNQFSYHHIQDKRRLLAGIYRILKPGGRFVITNLDPWSMSGWIVYRFFPASRQRDLLDFLSVDELTSVMEKSGYRNILVERIHNSSEQTLKDFLDYSSRRYRTSQLIAIADAEYEAGIARLKGLAAEVGGEYHIPSELSLVWVTGDKPGE